MNAHPKAKNKLRIVFVVDWFAERMGYAENMLPKALVALGHEVHVITSNVKPYFDSPNYKKIYENFLGPAIVDCEVRQIDGYTLYRLPLVKAKHPLSIKGLMKKVLDIRPDIIQVFDICSINNLKLILAKTMGGFKLFTASHLHTSVFPLAQSKRIRGVRNNIKYILTFLQGRLISFFIERCYPISPDAAEIVIRFFGVPQNKVKLSPLGVDTDLFQPLNPDSKLQRENTRQRFHFSSSDVVCIYTGRFSEDKDPLCLANAIELLINKGYPVRGLFIGNGPQTDVIKQRNGCVVHPFVAVGELADLFRAADIGVWPKQESTSQLDAMACGLPIILSNKITVYERVEGNGLLFEENNVQDLADKIITLLNPDKRAELGNKGVEKIRNSYTWLIIAQKRVDDYKAALK